MILTTILLAAGLLSPLAPHPSHDTSATVLGWGVALSATRESTICRLQEAQRRLDNSDRMPQLITDVERALVRAINFTREQRSIETGMDSLAAAGGAVISEGGRRLYGRKIAMYDEIADLEREIRRLKQEALPDQSLVAELLDDAESIIEENNLKERIHYSLGLVGIEDHEFMNEFEAETTRVVEELQEGLQKASDAL